MKTAARPLFIIDCDVAAGYADGQELGTASEVDFLGTLQVMTAPADRDFPAGGGEFQAVELCIRFRKGKLHVPA